MIYSIVGSNAEKRHKALRELKKLGKEERYLYREHIEELESLIDGASLFGGASIVICSGLMENEEEKKKVIELLPMMESSPNTFIIDEPFGTIHTYNKLEKFSVKIFDAKEKPEKDARVFLVCNAFAARNKKDAWLTFMAIRGDESGEAIAGALWWKWQEVWKSTLMGNGSLYTKEECERIGKDLVSAPLRAHAGKTDLMVELERIILSV